MDLRTLDLNLLKVFHVLLEEQSVTRAAARLSLTQPAVSGIMQRLREKFGDPLFVRAQRGIVPTPRALALAVPLRQVLADIEQLIQPTAFDPRTAELTLAIAGTDYSLSAVVVPFLAALRQQGPHIRVAMRPIQDDLVEGQLARGELDLALLTPTNAPENLHARSLFDEHYVCVMRQQHPALTDGKLSLEDFCELDHVIVSYVGGGFSGATDAALAAIGKTRRVVLSVPSFLVLPDVLKQSDLVAMVPSRLVGNDSQLAIIPAPIPVAGFTKILAWHERTHASPAHQWLRQLLADQCQQPPTQALT